MKKYFLLILVSGVVLVGCQQAEESNSTVDVKPSEKEVIAEKENTTKVEQKDISINSNSAVETTNQLEEKKVEKSKATPKPATKPKDQKKVTKKKPKAKKPEKKLSADLIKNTKTAASNKPKGPLPKLEFEYMSFDFGTVDEGDTVTHKFKFRNTGDAPAIISEASSSCGCTVPDYPKKPIKPGASGVVEVMFNTKGKLLEQKKSITLTANTQPKYNTLYLEGLVYRRPAKKEDDKEKDEKKKDKKKNTKNGKGKKDTLDVKKKTSSKKAATLIDSLKNVTTKNLDKPEKKKQ